MKKDEPTPLIVGDASWADTIPDWLLTEIEAERMVYGLAEMMGKDVPKVGNAELCAYLMTAAMRAPMTHEYTEIYVYVTAELMQKRGMDLEPFPFLKEKLDKGLTDWEQRELEELKSSIYRKRGGKVNHPVLDALRDLKKEIVSIPEGMEAQKTLEV